MARIKIKDLPKDKKISREEMKKVLGGFNPQPDPPGRSLSYGGPDTRGYGGPDTISVTDVDEHQWRRG